MVCKGRGQKDSKSYILTMLLGRLTSELICLFAKTTKAAITAWMKMGRAMAGGGGQHMVYVLYLHALVQSNPYLIAISPDIYSRTRRTPMNRALPEA